MHRAVRPAQVLGSMELLGNPTGLLAALAQGIQDLLLLPLEARSARQASRLQPSAGCDCLTVTALWKAAGVPASAGLQLSLAAAQFLAGLGSGSTGLLRGVGGWGLSSMAGFTAAAARALRPAADRCPGLPVAPEPGSTPACGCLRVHWCIALHICCHQRGLARVLRGRKANGTGSLLPSRPSAEGQGRQQHVTAPAQPGRRGFLGSVGLPLSGAFSALSSVSAGRPLWAPHAMMPLLWQLCTGTDPALERQRMLRSVLYRQTKCSVSALYCCLAHVLPYLLPDMGHGSHASL